MNPATLAAIAAQMAHRTVTCRHCHQRQVLRARPGSAQPRCRHCGQVLVAAAHRPDTPAD